MRIAVLLTFVKPAVLLAYALLGIFLLASAAGRRVRLIPIPPWLAMVGVAFFAGEIWLSFGLHVNLYTVSVLLGIAAFALKERAWRSGSLLFAGVAVVICSTSLAWWLSNQAPHSGRRAAVAFAGVVWCLQAGFMRIEGRPRRNLVPWLFLVFAIAGFALLANVTQYEPGSRALRVLLHHQGAYIGSALHIRAGLVPFYDVPLQYGLVPTVLIAAGCGMADCWSGMAFLTVSTTLAMAVLILWMALTTQVPRGTTWRVTAACVVFAAMFMWNALPEMGSLPIASPSVGGLRFLPVTLLAFLLFFQKTGLAAAILFPTVLWSPETAVMSLVIFGVCETSRIGVARAAMRSAGIVGASFAILAIVHHMIYGVWIQPDVMAEYVLHVPGPLPIELFSDFVVLAAALGMAAWNVWRRPADRLAFQRDVVASSLLFAASSYYLGRSHTNNVCNLMPFIVLVALRSLDGESPARFPNLPRLAILGMSVATAALTLSPWNTPPFRNGFSADASQLATAALYSDDFMTTIRAHIANPQQLPIADLGDWNRNVSETTVWTAMDPACLYAYVPSQRRQLYIKRSAARLHLGGWVILNQAQLDWLDDFRVAYRVTNEVRYTLKAADTQQTVNYYSALLTPLDEAGQAKGR